MTSVFELPTEQTKRYARQPRVTRHPFQYPATPRCHVRKQWYCHNWNARGAAPNKPPRLAPRPVRVRRSIRALTRPPIHSGRRLRESPHGLVLQGQLVLEFACSLQQRGEMQTESRFDMLRIASCGSQASAISQCTPSKHHHIAAIVDWHSDDGTTEYQSDFLDIALIRLVVCNEVHDKYAVPG